ncbi:hypothetical protein Peur_063903 [Populus x canadensis]
MGEHIGQTSENEEEIMDDLDEWFVKDTERNASSRSNPTTLICAEKRKKSEIGSDDDKKCMRLKSKKT